MLFRSLRSSVLIIISKLPKHPLDQNERYDGPGEENGVQCEEGYECPWVVPDAASFSVTEVVERCGEEGPKKDPLNWYD